MNAEKGNLIVDLNGYTWENSDKIIELISGTVSVYDSSEAKTGTITATGDDTINIQSGNATFKDITVYGAVDSADGIFILGGNVTVENCTVSSGKAGINVDNRNGNAVVNVKGGKFANYTDSKDASGRNCAIELRNNASNVTLSGDITFETNGTSMYSSYRLSDNIFCNVWFCSWLCFVTSFSPLGYCTHKCEPLTSRPSAL